MSLGIHGGRSRVLPSRRSAAKASSISRRIVCRVASSGLFSSISRPEGPYDASMLGLLLRDRGEDIRRLAVHINCLEPRGGEERAHVVRVGEWHRTGSPGRFGAGGPRWRSATSSGSKPMLAGRSRFSPSAQFRIDAPWVIVARGHGTERPSGNVTATSCCSTAAVMVAFTVLTASAIGICRNRALTCST